MKKALWTAMASFVPLFTSWAVSVTVNQSGGGDFTTIQAAIDSDANIITITDSGHYVENLQIGDPVFGVSGPFTLTSTQCGANRPVISPSMNKNTTTAVRTTQSAGVVIYGAGGIVLSNLVIEADPNLGPVGTGVGALLVLANNVHIEDCLIRIAPGSLAAPLGSSFPLLYLAQQGTGANELVPGVNPTPDGWDCNGTVVRNCEFVGVAPDSNPVEPTSTSQGYLGRPDNGTGTAQSSGYVRMDHFTYGLDVTVTFEGCYFHHCRDYGIFPTNLRNGAGSVNVIVRQCRFDAQAKFQIRGRGANIVVESSIFTRANQLRNTDEENSAVAIQTQSGLNLHIPSGSVSNCVFYNCGSANAQRGYYGGVNNPNGLLMAVDHCTFVTCLNGVSAGRTTPLTVAQPVVLTVSNSIFHQIGDNVPPAVDAAGVTMTTSHPDLVGGLYPAWLKGLANFSGIAPNVKWSAVFNRAMDNGNGAQIIIGNCIVGTVDTEDTRSWPDVVAANDVLGCRLFAGYDTNFVGAETITRAIPVFASTDPDGPNPFQLASGSPGQGMGADLAPLLTPKIVATRIGNTLKLSWSQPIWMKAVLKSTPSLPAPVWTPVAGVCNNTVTVPIGAGNEFFAIVAQ